MSLLTIGWLLTLAAALHAAVGIGSAIHAFRTARKADGITWAVATAFTLGVLSFLCAVVVAMMASNVFDAAKLVTGQ